MVKGKGIGGKTGFLGCAAVALALLAPGVATAHPENDSSGTVSEDPGGSTTPSYGDTVGQPGTPAEEPQPEPVERPGPSGGGASNGDGGNAAPSVGSAVAQPAGVTADQSAAETASARTEAGAAEGAGSAEASATSSRGEAAGASSQPAPGKADPKPDKRQPRAIPMAAALDASAPIAPPTASGETADTGGGAPSYLWIALAALGASGLGAAGWFALVRRGPREPDVDGFPPASESLTLEAELQAMLAEERAREEEHLTAS